MGVRFGRARDSMTGLSMAMGLDTLPSVWFGLLLQSIMPHILFNEMLVVKYDVTRSDSL